MDTFLAELYGTNDPTQDDMEKNAHLAFLTKLAEEEGIDLDELSDEDLEELAAIAAESMEEGEPEEIEEGDDLEKEAAAKVEEADFLGRVMAHSFTQELDNIEKDAGARMEAAKAALGRGARAVGAGAREAGARGARAGRQFVGENVKRFKKSPLGRFAEPSTLGGRMKARLRAAGRSIDTGVRGIGMRLGAKSTAQGAMEGAKATGAGKGGKLRAALRMMGSPRRTVRGAMAGAQAAKRSQRLRGYGALGGGAAVLGGAGAAAAAAGREKQSADEAWNEAIQSRAWEHLMAAGLADEQGNFIPAEELNKTAGTEDLDYQVDAAALELLEAEGYPVEWY